jgi:hypothetical protein
MAYFYFNSREVKKRDLNSLLRSLLIQLSTQSSPFFDILSRLYSTHHLGVQQPDGHTMKECIKEMLTLGVEEPTYIILDGLDECPISPFISPSRESLLEFVVGLVNLHLPNLRICVTSRLEHDIQVALEHLTPHPVTLHDEFGQQQDIANYVTSFVRSNETMRRWPEADRDLATRILLEEADGM